MAAGALEKAAEKNGCVIKVEKRGSKGSTDVLSAGDIADAKAVIIASDIDVPMERFDGKRVVRCSTDDCIASPDTYIDQAVSGGVSQFDAAKARKESDEKTRRPGSQANRGIAGFLAMILPFFTGAAAYILFMCVIRLMSHVQPVFADISGAKSLVAMMITAVVTGFNAGIIAGDEGMAVGFFSSLLMSRVRMSGNWLSAGSVVTVVLLAVIIAVLSGVLVLLLKKVFSGIPAKLTWLKNIILIPLIGCAVTEALVWFALNPLAVMVGNLLG